MKPRAIKNLNQLPFNEFITQISIGLGKVHENCVAQKNTFNILVENNDVRGSRIIKSFLEEESAKYLILLDSVRCPWKDKELLNNQLIKFNSHLAKHLYAHICACSPATYQEIKNIIENESKSHYLDGPNDVDWIFRNSIMAKREENIYVDYVSYSDGIHAWITPKPHPQDPELCFGISDNIKIFNMVDALHRIGISSYKALTLFSNFWEKFEYSENTHYQTFRKATIESIQALEDSEELNHFENEGEFYSLILNELPFPLYKENMKEKDIKVADLMEIQKS